MKWGRTQIQTWNDWPFDAPPHLQGHAGKQSVSRCFRTGTLTRTSRNFTKTELDRWPVIIPPASSKPSARLAKACYQAHSFPHQNSVGKSLRSLFLHTRAVVHPILSSAPQTFRHLWHFCIKLRTSLQREAPPVTGIRRALRKHMGVSVFRSILWNRPSYPSHHFRFYFRLPPRSNLFSRLTNLRKAHGFLADLEQKPWWILDSTEYFAVRRRDSAT